MPKTSPGTHPQPSSASTFDLIDDPWLPCLLVDGTATSLSMRQLLLRAHHVQDLVPDAATQYPPILRMLLAVVHRAVGQGPHPGPRSKEEWTSLWGQRRLPADRISRYLDEVRHRFDLFHPRTPFGQVAGLRSSRDETKTIALTIPFMAAGNNAPLFSAVRDHEPPSLTPAEAARWLLHAHAWDTAAIKTAAVGDPKANAGKTTGNPTGPLGQLGVLIPTGPTLWHTLMYNLKILNADISGSGDLPSWERPCVDATWRERTPAGLLDLYTWLGRRIRLVAETTPEGPRVRRVVLCAGDRLRIPDLWQVRQPVEPHTAWRRSTTLEKKLGRTVYMPIVHQPGRQLWRGLGAILAHQAVTDTTPPQHYTPPGILAQLRELAGGPLAQELLLLRAIGMTYGNKNATIEETYVDDLPLPVAVLRLTDHFWETAALNAVRDAENAARDLGQLAVDLAKAAGCKDDRVLNGRRDNARMRLYATLDQRFRRWIAALGGDASPRQALDQWRSTVRTRTYQIADELLLRVPPAAIRGRPVHSGRDRTEWLDSALAERCFRNALDADLPQPPKEADH
ncbi:CRISPR-associated protein CasA/Cse1 [Actinomadura sp. NBRC 104412]|uniref:type I-E CRISPR-associated protein Cse1/CasA n=1 Tax=Actinomadura sp. NBRC 104412 TaxID=3032203 RepID=UPI0024A01CBA|nr:type I-E CRISPR-associated protein Cse1/CasA [Actinomadura sp. NBRC 104412]GLZ09188.1 CRISPR-associated protein CasA/Cse1 [Actinomadura sp. NBRC 104412]